VCRGGSEPDANNSTCCRRKRNVSPDIAKWQNAMNKEAGEEAAQADYETTIASFGGTHLPTPCCPSWERSLLVVDKRSNKICRLQYSLESCCTQNPDA
jgi:hypothetical protein